jgi:hypothetical protein
MPYPRLAPAGAPDAAQYQEKQEWVRQWLEVNLDASHSAH